MDTKKRVTIESVLDGANPDIGAIDDTAITDPTANATVIAALKGIIEQLQDTNYTSAVEIAATDYYDGSTPDLANDGAYDYTETLNLKSNNYSAAQIFVALYSSGTTDDVVVSVFATDQTDFETVPSYSFQISAASGEAIVSFIVPNIPLFRIGLKTTGTTDTFDYRISAQYLKRGA